MGRYTLLRGRADYTSKHDCMQREDNKRIRFERRRGKENFQEARRAHHEQAGGCLARLIHVCRLALVDDFRAPLPGGEPVPCERSRLRLPATKRYDARKTIEVFSAKMRNQTDLVGAVGETMQPAHVSLRLRPPQERTNRSELHEREVEDV